MSSSLPASNDSRLLVTGASGQLGQRIVHHLLHTVKVAPHRIVAGSRSPDSLKSLADLGVLTRRVDFNDEASVKAAAEGVDRALLISGNDIFGRLEGHKTAVRALAAAGVHHVLYTSLQEADRATAFVADDHRETERVIREGKFAGYTFLRNALYFENTFGNIAGASKSGQWFSAAKDGKDAAIARDDTARAAAYALARSDNTEKNVFEITGAEALTIEESVANVSKAIEKPIQVVHVSVEDLAHGIAAATGLPEAVAKAFASFDVNTAEGHAATVTDHYKQLTGVNPQTHQEWLAANKATLQAL